MTAALVREVSRTVLTLTGAGWLTTAISRSAMFLALLPKKRGARAPWMPALGPLLILAIAAAWVLLLWLGLFLILGASDVSVVRGPSGRPATVAERIYFSGYTISTMGNGDFRPNGSGWQVVTVIFSLAGFGLLTATITYFVPVLSAVIRAQQLAVNISLIGRTPAAVLRWAWNDGDFSRLEQEAASLRSLLTRHSRSHLAYPVIHHFGSNERGTSAVLMLVVLDEALTTLLHAGRQPWEELPQIDLLRRAIDAYLATVSAGLPGGCVEKNGPWQVASAGGEGSGLDPAKARELAGLPDVRERRRLLRQLLASGGWRVRDVTDG